jgi:hypothetical protein
VFRKFGYILMLFAALSATGTHWFALQSIAWTTMLAENLQTSSWHSAFERTFDGKHPCCLCKQIAAGKQSEKKSDAQLEAKKLDYSYTSFEFVFSPPSAFYEVRDLQGAVASQTRAPSVPPPRSLLA